MKVNETVLKCTHCNPSEALRELNRPWGNTGKRAEYYKGFIGVQIYTNAPLDYDYKIQHLICPFCNNKLIDTKFKSDDLHLLGKSSGWDRTILDSMMELFETDPIEYRLKINEIKLQQEQQKIIKEQQRNANRVCCPYCNSTNVKRITATERAVSVIGLGILSKKINKSFKCRQCGGTF